jgi:D-alanyl-D-alanine carboxypeptidase/D-alanyl-D-alanine-endopeptidase (penicillin-binding protein 4)
VRLDLPGGMRLHGWHAAAVPTLVLTTLLALLAGLVGWLPGQGGTSAAASSGSGSPSASASSTFSPSAFAAPAPAVLVPVGSSAPLPTTAGLAAALSALLARADLGRHVGGAVIDLATGRLVFGSGADDAFAPASTIKLLTATAALATLGPDYRIQTRVVAGASAGQVVLVGGGDPTLATSVPAGFVPAPASLTDLAARTVAALRAAGLTTVRVGYDTSLFTGPTQAPTWPETDLTTGVVSAVTALSIDEGRVGPIVEGMSPRVSDPPLAAAGAFARRLVALGIKVVGQPSPVKAPAPASAARTPTPSATGSVSGARSPAAPAPGTTLAMVRSPALSDLVGWMLAASDNDLAEAVARLVAVRVGQSPDFAGGVRAVTDVVAGLGVPVSAVRMYDASGLTRSTQVSPAVLAAMLALADSADHPTLRSLLTGMAVAGFSGTLTDRFWDSITRPAAGLVRAKTGTLSAVSSIAGTVVDVDGRELGFVFLADQVPAGGTLAARESLDRMVAAVAGCGCR